MIRAPQDHLTLDDLERLAFTYGGTIRRNVITGSYTLVGALMDGRRVTLGPVWSDDAGRRAS